jgi:hypothetical protein
VGVLDQPLLQLDLQPEAVDAEYRKNGIRHLMFILPE